MNASLAVTVSVGFGFLILAKFDIEDGEPWWDPVIEDDDRATAFAEAEEDDELDPDTLGFKRLYSQIELAPQA